jgi:hypothetical protein
VAQLRAAGSCQNNDYLPPGSPTVKLVFYQTKAEVPVISKKSRLKCGPFDEERTAG